MWGTFTSPELHIGADSFHAMEAWRGLPGVVAPPLDPYVTVATVDGTLFAHVLDTPWRRVIDSVSIASIAAPFVDNAWVSSHVVTGGAPWRAGSMAEPPSTSPRSTSACRTKSTCPEFGYYCGNETPTFTLAGDRCLMPTGCAARCLCPEYSPACHPGYDLLSWPTQPGGCPAFACMPTWLQQGS